MRPRSPLKVSAPAATSDSEEPDSQRDTRRSSRSAELDALYRSHARSVARWAFLLGGPGVEPEDVMQEVFVIAHRELGSLGALAEAPAWLHRITVNVVRNRRRKERARIALHRFGALAGITPRPPPGPGGRSSRRRPTPASTGSSTG